MDKTTIIMIVSLLLVLTVTGMTAFMLSNAKAAQKKRMMTVIRGGQAEGSGRKINERDLRRQNIEKKLKTSGEQEGGEKGKKTIATALMQAGLSISVRQYWIYSILFAVSMTALVYLSGKGLFVVVMTAIISLFGVPKFVIKRMTMKRQKKFLADLADALEAMTRLLRAGMPVTEAIKMVSREFNGPIGEEMSRIFDQQKIGVTLPDAVLECARRMPLTEMQMFATAVTIQAQTGSSLSEILENLAKVIRARFRLRRKVQALSSEAKSSAMIIGALPIFVATAMYFINPDYIGTLFHTETGKWLLTGAILWMLMGVLCMKQMINFKV